MSWYQTSSDTPAMEQVVIDPGPAEYRDSDRMLMLSSLYVRVYQNPWISVLLKLDIEDAPAILIRADGSTESLKDQRFKIGFSFIRGCWGNIFALFIDFEGPCPDYCPTKPLVFFEDILGLDFEENRERFLNHLDTDRIGIWLAEGGDSTVENDVMRAEPVHVKYEASINIEPECRSKLNELMRRLIEDHLAIGETNWDWQRSFQAFAADMPTTQRPVLPRPGGDSSAVGGRPEDTNAKSGNGCFIATACYGSDRHADVVFLRQFRDAYLLDTVWGQRFINFYYRASPPMAERLADKHMLKSLIRNVLIRPIVLMLRSLGY